MLVIKKEQTEKLRLDLYSGFIDRVINHLWKRYPEKLVYLSQGEIKDKITRYIELAQNYSLEYEQDIASYIEFTFYMGELFENKPENFMALEILNNNFLDGTEKIESLRNFIFGISINTIQATNQNKFNYYENMNNSNIL